MLLPRSITTMENARVVVHFGMGMWERGEIVN